MTTRRTERGRPLYYIAEHKWNGYNQRFSKIETWTDVCLWARDGSLKEGEQVFAVYACKQPSIRRVLVIDHPRGKAPRRAGGKAGRGR